ncbi:MAG: hypothetical protein EWM73_03047 [Nitrospira sp.]|nr:MAG: hypothetical protein EWM73_03047 [Nitrospira sp.]
MGGAFIRAVPRREPGARQAMTENRRYVSYAQQRAVEFYTRQLGFEVRRRLPMGPKAPWIEVAPFAIFADLDGNEFGPTSQELA